MCGLTGYLTTSDRHAHVNSPLKAMVDALTHRGPDEYGEWFSGDGSLAIGHRRLAIQDLSPAGCQPMTSASGRFVIAFNGEIYNFQVLRRDLEQGGAAFTGHSDTEVMLAAFESWGVETALGRFAGMFAFALFDQQEQRLYLARDRMGEKPLYYGWQGQTLVFGSELKALQQHPEWRGEINRSALPLLVRHNLIPAPHTIYSGVFKLPPSSLIAVDLACLKSGDLPNPSRYWRLEDQFAESQGWTVETAADHLEELLTEVIGEQMVSDVPLGAFLSGGVDSSTVVALMQKQASTPVKTFSIGFSEEGFNEAEHAAAVAQHLGTDHTELYVTEQDALKVIPLLGKMYDEPFADSSQIPTFLVSQMTRKKVTVALSGDGGDELFCGYTRYPGTVSAWSRRRSLKSMAENLLARLPENLSVPAVRALIPSQRSRSNGGISFRLDATRSVTDAGDLSEFYRRRVSLWPYPGKALIMGEEPTYGLNAPLPETLPDTDMKTLMWRDLNWYLPDDILVKVDRAAMACSLETRIPMLDHRVVSFALGLPTGLNVKAGVGKQVLRSVLYRHVPKELIDRPKQGFAVPVAHWLRGALKEWAEALLEPARLREQGYWQVDMVRWLWNEHLSGREDYSFQLWGILMFQAWLVETGNSGHG